MSLKVKHLCVAIVLSAFSPFVEGREFTTQSLDMMDFADMEKLLHSETRQCYRKHSQDPGEMELAEVDEIDASSGIKQTDELRGCLKNVLTTILTRREQHDGVQRTLLQKALLEIQENYRFVALKEVAAEAITKYKNSKLDKKRQATAYEIIKNVLAAAEARLNNEAEQVRPIIDLIKTSDLEVDAKLISFRANGPGGLTPNLSLRAAQLLK